MNLIVGVFIWETGVLWLLDFFWTSGGITHGSGAVDLVPAAEDEAGFSIIHPADRQIDEEKSDRHIKGSFAGIVEGL